MTRTARTRRGRRYRRTPPWWWPAWGVVGAVAVGIVALATLGMTDPLDAALCPESGATTETVVLIDASTPLTAKQRSELRRLIREMGTPNTKMHVPAGGRITAYHLPDVTEVDETLIEAVESVCNPGTRPQDRGWLDDLTQGQLIALQTWRQFEQRLEDMFPAKADEGNAGSPILETLTVIIPRHAASARGDQGRRLHLVLWSDLLENSQFLQQYEANGYPDAEGFMQGQEYRHLHTDMHGVDVTLFRLEQPIEKMANAQDAAHYRWWREVLTALGARIRWQESI